MTVHADRLGIKIVFSLEEEPLGTAGPLALARYIIFVFYHIMLQKRTREG